MDKRIVLMLIFLISLNFFLTSNVYANNPPNATIENITGAENTNITFTLPTTDSDGDPLTYSSDNPNITWNGTHLYYETDYDTVLHPNLTKTITVNITADDTLLTYTQEVNITIIDVNRAPYFVLYPINSECNISQGITYTTEDAAINWTDCNVSMDNVIFDPDGDELSYSFYDWGFSPSRLSVEPECKQSISLFPEPACAWRHDSVTNMFQYKIAENYLGNCYTYINITDSYGLVYSNESTFYWQITTGNVSTQDAPILAKPLPVITLFEDEYNDTWNPIGYFNEYDCESLSYSIQNSTNILSDNITWNFTSLNENWFGEENLTLTATDNIEDITVNLTVRILPVNDAPILYTPVPNTTFDEDTKTQIDFSKYFSDVDNETLTYTLTANTEISIESVTENLITLTSTPNWNGQETITIHASDGQYEVTDTFKITINPVNDAPTIATITAMSVYERDKISLTPIAIDIDNDPLTYYTNNSNLIWNTTSASFDWTPTYNQSGNYTVNVTVSDGIINDSTITTIEVIDKYHRNDILLEQGWNLISYPYTLDNTSVTDIMSSITSDYTIWAYNSLTKIWSEYDSNKEPHLNNLTDISNKESFWINISFDENLTVIGTRPESITIDLNQGWNLISYPLDTQKPINTTLSQIAGKYTILWEFNEDTGWDLYNPDESNVSTIDYFIPGSGYWINMTESKTLIFSY
ncbi:MAG: hypothetical protein K0B07_02110 [DPANN group archaeon]|nr:hypothetical protein [DPANN group archaeon]